MYNQPARRLKVHYLSICVCGKNDQRHSIVLNVKNIHLFAYFGMSPDLYDDLLPSCSNEYFFQWQETISDAYLTDTPSCFPFIEPRKHTKQHFDFRNT